MKLHMKKHRDQERTDSFESELEPKLVPALESLTEVLGEFWYPLLLAKSKQSGPSHHDSRGSLTTKDGVLDVEDWFEGVEEEESESTSSTTHSPPQSPTIALNPTNKLASEASFEGQIEPFYVRPLDPDHPVDSGVDNVDHYPDPSTQNDSYPAHPYPAHISQSLWDHIEKNLETFPREFGKDNISPRNANVLSKFEILRICLC